MVVFQYYHLLLEADIRRQVQRQMENYLVTPLDNMDNLDNLDNMDNVDNICVVNINETQNKDSIDHKIEDKGYLNLSSN